MKKVLVFLISLFVVPMVFSQTFRTAEDVIDCANRTDCNDLRNLIIVDMNGDGLPDIVGPTKD